MGRERRQKFRLGEVGLFTAPFRGALSSSTYKAPHKLGDTPALDRRGAGDGAGLCAGTYYSAPVPKLWEKPLASEVIELLKQLIRFDTVSPEGKQYEDLVKFLKGWLEERGVSARIEYVDPEYKAKACPKGGPRPILFAWVGEGEPILEFNGHYDVVPPGEGWEDAFEPKLEGEYLIGRGASDMKSGIAAVAAALANISDWKGPKVQAVFVPDEEVGGECGTGYRVSHLKDKYPIGKHVLIAEPGGVYIGHKGMIWIKVKVKGKQAHASRPWEGENAFLKASALALKIGEELFQRFLKRPSSYEYESQHPFSKFNVFNMGGIARSNTSAFNIIPEEFTFSLDVRVIPEERAENVAREVLEIIGDEAEKELVEMMEPFINPNSTLAKIIIEKGWAEREVVSEGGLDLRFYRGYDAVSWGPGITSEAHKIGEKVNVKRVEEFVKYYSQLPKELVARGG